MIEFSTTSGWYVIGFGAIAVLILGLLTLYLHHSDKQDKSK